MKKTAIIVLLLICALLPSSVMVSAQAHFLNLQNPASNLYEVETSVVLPATIAWPSDSTAVEVANAEIRPNTVFLRVDENLNVKSMSGFNLNLTLVDYLRQSKENSLSALYIDSENTAEALIDFIHTTQVSDLFVVAASANIELVKEVSSASPNVYGIVDFSDVNPANFDPAAVIAETHEANARIALIPEAAATREVLDYIRGRLTTVWVAVSANEKSIYTQLTNGANGIYCEDYELVISALESFEEPNTLLRPSFIAGHRGLPSQYVENTLRSAQGAFEAGADVLECDIYLSADDQLFILHDDTLDRLFNVTDGKHVEDYTLAELQEFAYDMTDEDPEKAPNSVLNSNNENRNKEGRADMEINHDPELDRIPALRDYLEEFKNSNITHFIEIKSINPEIVLALKDLCEELEVTDQVVVISFVAGFDGRNYYPQYDVLKAMKDDWSAMPQGYLGYDSYTFADNAALVEDEGNAVNAAVQLMAATEPYNATYNPYFGNMSYETVVEGRHRGLTCWPWTYNNELYFADAYLKGIYGITSNYATWASDIPKYIQGKDTVLENGDKLEYVISTQSGEEIKSKKVELVQISGIPVEMNVKGEVSSEEYGEALVMLKLSEELNINDFDLSELEDNSFTIYSNPFTLVFPEPEEN